MTKRRLIDQIGDSPTFVAEGVRQTGDLETPGPLVVCGTGPRRRPRGGMLRMSVTAQWEGEIHALAGGGGRPDHRPAGGRGQAGGRRHRGHPRRHPRPSIAVAKGAVIDGVVTVTSGEPVIEFEEKRGAG